MTTLEENVNSDHSGGVFIAFCGIDGSGKTTQLRLLEKTLSDKGEVFTTRQPTDAYRQDPVIREFLNQETPPEEYETTVREMALYAAADRLRHLRREVHPRLRKGHTVLTDRYVYSSYAYFLARGIDDLDWLMQLNRHAPTPDLVVYLDIDPALAIERILARDGHSRKREEIDLDVMRRVRESFVTQPWGKSEAFHVVDATSPPEKIAEHVVELARNL